MIHLKNTGFLLAMATVASFSPLLAQTQARFDATIDYSDDHSAMVDLHLDCNTGISLSPTLSIGEQQVGSFYVQDFVSGTMSCELSADAPPGYTVEPTLCRFEEILDGSTLTCEFSLAPEQKVPELLAQLVNDSEETRIWGPHLVQTSNKALNRYERGEIWKTCTNLTKYIRQTSLIAQEENSAQISQLQHDAQKISDFLYCSIEWFPNQSDPGCNVWSVGEPFPVRSGPDASDGDPIENIGWELCTYLPAKGH